MSHLGRASNLNTVKRSECVFAGFGQAPASNVTDAVGHFACIGSSVVNQVFFFFHGTGSHRFFTVMQRIFKSHRGALSFG